MSYTGKHCKTCGDPTHNETDLCWAHTENYSTPPIGGKHHNTIMVVGAGSEGLEIAEVVARLHALGHTGIQVIDGKPDVFMFDGQEYHLPVRPEMTDQDIVNKLLTLQEKSIWERKEMENSKCLIPRTHDDNDLYGYRKNRQGSNKKYTKRKKAKNGRTKKRRK